MVFVVIHPDSWFQLKPSQLSSWILRHHVAACWEECSAVRSARRPHRCWHEDRPQIDAWRGTKPSANFSKAPTVNVSTRPRCRQTSWTGSGPPGQVAKWLGPLESKFCQNYKSNHQHDSCHFSNTDVVWLWFNDVSCESFRFEPSNHPCSQCPKHSELLPRYLYRDRGTERSKLWGCQPWLSVSNLGRSSSTCSGGCWVWKLKAMERQGRWQNWRRAKSSWPLGCEEFGFGCTSYSFYDVQQSWGLWLVVHFFFLFSVILHFRLWTCASICAYAYLVIYIYIYIHAVYTQVYRWPSASKPKNKTTQKGCVSKNEDSFSLGSRIWLLLIFKAVWNKKRCTTTVPCSPKEHKL